MPNPLRNVLLSGTSYDYQHAAVLSVFGGQGGTAVITGGNVWGQLQQASSSFQGSEYWADELLFGPGGLAIPAGATGIAFRNDDATKPGTIVYAAIMPPGSLFASQTFTSQVTATTTANMITGIIPATGTTPIGGSGFTYTHTDGTGVYVFTLTTPMASAPTITTAVNTSIGRGAAVTAQAATGFTITTFNTNTGASVDVAFQFVAVPTV